MTVVLRLELNRTTCLCVVGRSEREGMKEEVRGREQGKHT